ncbi:unnamed protein product [Discula destructiva]
MTTVEYPLHDFYARQNATYTSLASSATASVCSDAPPHYQPSDAASARWTHGLTKPLVQTIVSEVPRSLRQNPRRTSSTATTRHACPPPLVRQTERKLNFVDNLVDSSTQIVMAIWPNSSPLCPEAARDSSVLPLRTFIQETLRRSRTSYSTLQVALYYLVLIKDKLPRLDFTMEQTDDCHSSRALQCGRRMFLAALILASKYLQDRNYSARAWSKISGLNTNEINQNEMAFVLAVNWKLHITEEVYHQWTDSVMKHSPSQPPTPPTSGSFAAKKEYEVQLDLFSKQCAYFQEIIRRLNPDLENLEDAVARSDCSRVPLLSPRSLSPRSALAAAQSKSGEFPFGSNDFGSRDATPIPTKTPRTPSTMEPSPASVSATATRIAPAFGLLPTPRLTPHVSASHDPWPIQFVYRGCASYKSRGSAMGMAMSAAGPVQQDMVIDKWPGPITSSPINYASRRPSLAASVSTTSSPESMVSDLSATSRSSSISSISSLASAPYAKIDYTNLEVQARCRSAKQLISEKYAVKSTTSLVVDDHTETTAPMNLDYTEWSARDEADEVTKEAAQAFHAAQALQALHNNGLSATQKPVTSAPKAGSKRSRPTSIDICLQENVRDLLRCDYAAHISTSPTQIPAFSCEGRKRVCCSAEAAQYQLPTTANQGPGMWEGILN